jgi:hypothetical protein
VLKFCENNLKFQNIFEKIDKLLSLILLLIIHFENVLLLVLGSHWVYYHLKKYQVKNFYKKISVIYNASDKKKSKIQAQIKTKQEV